MKKITFLILISFLSGMTYSQYVIKFNPFDTSSTFVKTMKWDTLLVYDSINNLVERHYQYFDVNEKVIMQKSENLLWNNWVLRQLVFLNSYGNITKTIYKQYYGTTDYYLYEYTYDSLQRISLEKKYYAQDTSSFINPINKSFTYSSQGKITRIKLENNTGMFELDTFLYDANLFLVQKYEYQYQNNQINSVNRFSYMNDLNGNPLTELVEYSYSNNPFSNYEKYIRTFDMAGNTTHLEYYFANGNTWNFQYMNDNTYSAANDLLSWEMNSNSKSRINWSYYSPGKFSEELYKYWTQNQWMDGQKTIRSYDTYGNCLNETQLYKIANSWFTESKYDLSYSSSNLILEGEYFAMLDSINWSKMSSVDLGKQLPFALPKIYGQRYTVHWLPSATNSMEQQQFIPPSVSVFPNPSRNSILQIEMTNSDQTNELSVFNLSGQKLINDSFTGSFYSLDISALCNGIYFIEIRNNAVLEVKKVVKE